MQKIIPLFLFCCLPWLFVSCDKILATDSETLLYDEQMFADDRSAESALVGLYAKVNGSFCLTNGYLSRYLSLYAGELVKTSGTSGSDHAFMQNSVQSSDPVVWELYSSAYNHIYHANLIIERLPKSPGIGLSMRSRMEGEARFLRALLYFYLVNLFGDVPLVLITNPDITFKTPRTAQQTVYNQIVTDLVAGQQLLPADYLPNQQIASNRIRANKWAATALLARVYLYMGAYAKAGDESNAVIQSGIYPLQPTSQNFQADSYETILGLYPTSRVYNTAEGRYFTNPNNTGKPTFVLHESLYQSFATNDLRLSFWIATRNINNQPYYSPYKYKVFESDDVKEYNIVLRSAEQYLIRAEAYLHHDRLADAVSDLNVIRKRAGLSPISGTVQYAIVQQLIEQERAREFFCEWGHRWFDLKRWPSDKATPGKTRLDDIMPIIKPVKWESYMSLLPIPGEELKKSTTLTQNAGYD